VNQSSVHDDRLTPRTGVAGWWNEWWHSYCKDIVDSERCIYSWDQSGSTNDGWNRRGEIKIW